MSNFSPFRNSERSELSNSTVWVYLFFLPFQLVSQFGYYTIPGVAIAAFMYLGFIAAGEEIEQPFGAALHVLFMPLNSFLILTLLQGYDDVKLFSQSKQIHLTWKTLRMIWIWT